MLSSRLRLARVAIRISVLLMKPAFVFVLACLGPEDLLVPDGAEHHNNHEEPNKDEDAGHDAADDGDGVSVERLGNGEGGCDEGGVGEDEREPIHGK